MKINSNIKNYLNKKEKNYKVKSTLQLFYFQVRKIIFFLMGLANNLILTESNELPEKEAIILGRGKGVIKYYKNNSIEFKTYLFF